MATSSFEREVIKSGYLTKSPSSGGRGRLKRRWFVLTSSKQDSHPSSGNGACALSSSSFRLDYFEKENHVRKGSIDLGERCLMLEDPDYICQSRRKKKRSSSCFNLILLKESSKHKSRRDAFASRFQLQACSEEEKQSWLTAFQQCGVSIHKSDKDVDDREHSRSNFYIADDTINDLEDSTSGRSSAIPMPHRAQLSPDLAATVPGGLTFASYTGEDVPLSELYNSEGGVLSSSFSRLHPFRNSLTPNAHAHSCEDIYGYGTSDQLLSPSRSRDSKDSMEFFQANSTEGLDVEEERSCERLSCDLHELSRQLESAPYVKIFDQDQILSSRFYDVMTMSGGRGLIGLPHQEVLAAHVCLQTGG